MRSGLDCMPGKQTNGRSHSCDWPSCSDRGAVTLLGFRFAAWPFPRGRRRLVMTQAVNLSRCRCSTQETVCCRKAPLSVVPLTAWLTKINRVMLRNWILHQERGWGQEVQYVIMDTLPGECSYQSFGESYQRKDRWIKIWEHKREGDISSSFKRLRVTPESLLTKGYPIDPGIWISCKLDNN